ncbi:MAG TPA: sugar phosphate nucleotidyltransferase [Gemmatimonadaceae bacterium]|nr:sugar phosphate nucleotidyltransferase [Gemmatimonadaceae bacterium]
MTRWAVVLAGGVGSRFWPLSTPERPKQLLPLVNDAPLLDNTLARLAPLVPASRTLLLTNASLAEPICALCTSLPRENVIAEPKPAGTAAALAWAAAEIERRAGPDAVMICVHADWAIRDEAGFRDTLSQAADVAERSHALVTVGIVPTRPDPGFGYIQPADAATGADAPHGARRVARFVEKPDRENAARMVRDGYLWNSGIFVWRVGDFLAELRRHTPEVAPALDACDGDLERFFAGVKPISVDVGVLERSDRVRVLPGDFGWDDVGTWAALRRVRDGDAEGNALSGPVHALQATGNVVHAEGNAVVLYGVSDLVVVTRDGLTLVTTVDRSADLKTLIDTLPAKFRAPA